jgi:hypothetical protein
MYYSTAHWLPLLNGFSAFAPPSYQDLLQRLQPFPTQAGIDYLRARGAKYLLVHSARYLNGGFEEDIAALRLVNRVRLSASFHSTNFGTTNVYELDEQ